jgi:hypothetical protein
MDTYKVTENVTVTEVTWTVKYNIIIKFLVVENSTLQTSRSPFQDFWLWRLEWLLKKLSDVMSHVLEEEAAKGFQEYCMQILLS